MTEQHATIPAAPDDSLDGQVAQIRRWIEGYIDKDGVRHPGLFEMVAELYDKEKARRERHEAVMRGLTIGGIVTLIGGTFAWLKDHIK